MSKENKLSLDFNPAPHTVISTKDSDVNVKNDVTGREYRRNIIHLKRVEGNWKLCDHKEVEEGNTSVPSEQIDDCTGT